MTQKTGDCVSSPDSETPDANQVKVDSAEWERLKAEAAKAQEHWDKVLRLTADFDNTKKRLEKRSQELVAYANEKILLEVVGIRDDLERAIKHLDEKHDVAQIREGLKITHENFKRVLARHGVEEIESLGKVFDANEHESIGEVETRDFVAGAVADEIMKGYRLNGRLLRPSRVRIAKVLS